MDIKNSAYVDTSALIAFTDRSDTYHSLFHRLFSSPPPLVTTLMVVAEGHGWFLRRYDRYKAGQFLAMIEAITPIEIVTVGQPEQLAATALIRRFSDQDLTLVDALGLHLLESRNIDQCWSTDFHLSLTGTPLVIHQQ